MELRLIVFVIYCTAISQCNASVYRTDIQEDGEKAFCQFRKHLTFKPTATCCANQVIKPGLDITTHWATCMQEKGGQSDTVEGIGWDVYSCILKKASGKDRLTLQEYADLITVNYPDDIKSKINQEVQSQKVSAASISNYGTLEKLRVTYYDIEKEVCEGMPSETKSYGKIEMCSTWKEESHRAGMCCRKSYPIDIRYQSLFDVGDPKTKAICKQGLHPGLVALNVSDQMEDAILDICDAVCELSQKFNFDIKSHITDNTYYWNFNVTQIMERFPFVIPQFLHPTMRQEVKDILTSTYVFNNTIKAMQNFEFADVVGGDSNTPRPSHNIAWVHRGNKSTGENFKYEFMGRRFHSGIIHVPIYCSAYKNIVAVAEQHIFKDCKPEDVTEAPAEAAPEPEPPAATSAPEPESTATEAAAE